MSLDHAQATHPTRRVLLVTLAPAPGGVHAMTRFVADTLRARGYTPVLAYYKPFMKDRTLSVPSWQLLTRRPQLRRLFESDGIEGIEIGVRLPELEIRRYAATPLWRQVLGEFDRIVVVSGSALTANAVVETGAPSLVWLATPYDGDRIDRVKTMPWYRRLIDRTLDAPACRAIERRVLERASVVALSNFTAGQFSTIAVGRIFPVMPVPVDTDFFRPAAEHPIPGRIGFVGRFADPRKNLPLLLGAVALCRRRGFDVSLSLVGDGAEAFAESMVEKYGLRGCTSIHASVSREELLAHYRRIDVLVLPSHQEGLGLVGLEAMACGTPVVATRCGGPEEYVKSDENGSLVGMEAGDIASAVTRLIADRTLRSRLSANARATVASQYSIPVATASFWRLFDAVEWRRGNGAQNS